jgi:hypothetical protein
MNKMTIATGLWLVLFGVPAAAGAQSSTANQGANQGARIEPSTRTVDAVAPPLTDPATFVELHSARVEHDLMLFKPTLVGMTPAGPARNALLERAPAKRQVRFFVPAESADGLEVRRDRDRLVLFRGPQAQGTAVATGLAMFVATTILSAHAPRAVRALFDGPIHLGPAIFDGGGMGAGIAGRSL